MSFARDRFSSSSEKVRKSADVAKRWRLNSGESKNKDRNSKESEESPLINTKIRGSRSHESVLTSPHNMPSIDLSAAEVDVKPLHSSVLGQDHCIHITTLEGSKYISCTTSEERDKWLSSLRRTIRPQEEHSRRSDNSLKFWVLEAKNVSPKKRYYCEILLDRTLYAQTSIKTMADMLFWGEHFEFQNLPAFDTITVNLYREADKKKKKDRNMLMGYIHLNMAEFENRKLTEKWFTCNSGTVGKNGKDVKNELPIIRLKARRQTVDILPLQTYQAFIEYLRADYKELCKNFEPILAVKEKEDLAISLVNVLQHQGKACDFLSDIVMEEISRLDDEQLTFRGNSIATKAMEAYMKLVGEKYLQLTLCDLINQLIQSPDDCEVDPAKVSSPQLLACQQKNLDMYSNMVWVKVTNSFCYFPNELREVFASIQSHCSQLGKGDYTDNLISSCIFLRFLCPAILYPSLFRLTQEYPDEKTSRNLTLIAKTIQTLANFTQFGVKEEFMTFMNAFVEKEAPNTRTFLRRISSQEVGNQFLQFDGHIDLGKELSVLHAILLEYTGKYSQTAESQFEKLNKIISCLASALDDPSVGQEQACRKSQMYDNLMCPSQAAEEVQSSNTVVSAPLLAVSHAALSPTQVLSDLLQPWNKSTDGLSTLTYQTKASNSHNLLSVEIDDTSTNSCVGIRKISVIGPYQVYNEQKQPESWMYASSDVDNLNDDYVGLISSMGIESQNSHLKQDNTHASNQPLAFANPLFGHSLQQSRKKVGQTEYPEIHHGITVNEARTMQRKSSDSSITSEDGENENFIIKDERSMLSDDSLSIIELKILSPLSQSSSDESLNGKLRSKMSSSKPHSSMNISATANSISALRAVKSDTTFLNNNFDGYSTFPRKQKNKQEYECDTRPANCQWKVKSITKEGVTSSVSLSDKILTFQTQLSIPSHESMQNSNEHCNTSYDKFLLDYNTSTSIISTKVTTKSENYKLKDVSTSAVNSACWEVTDYVEVPCPSQETSSSRDSSPKSLFSSTDHDMPSMNESGSAHSNISMPLSSQPWRYTSSSSDSSSPIANMSKMFQGTPVKSDSYRTSQSLGDFSSVHREISTSNTFSNTGFLTQESEHVSRSSRMSNSLDLGYLYQQQALTGKTDELTCTRLRSRSSLTDDESSHSITNTTINRRHSAHSAIHLGISSVQRKLQEQERTKQEFEHQVHILRQQLLEAQERLQHTELRLLDHEIDSQKLMDEWQYRLVESEEKIKRQQAEKDEQLNDIISRLHSVEEELKKEHAEMANVVQHKQQVIELQEQRIKKLDEANNKLLQVLTELRAEGTAVTENSSSSSCSRAVQSYRVVGLRTSSC